MIMSEQNKAFMPNIRVSVDVDSVLADIHKPFIQEYNNRHGTDVSVEHFTDWDFGDSEVTTDDYLDITQEIWESWGEDIPMMDTSAPEKVAEIHNRDEIHFVDIVTARQGVEEEMQEWLDGMGITEYGRFYSVNDKAEKGYDIYIDDNPNLYPNLMFYQFQYLKDRPYNRSVEDSGQVARVGSVGEAVDDLIEFFGQEE